MTGDALAALRSGGKRALSQALAAVEAQARDQHTIALLDAAFADPRGASLGVTGPPGVGKSSLVNVLLREARRRGMTVGAIAVDPSSARTGGALLGDRARLSAVDPGDQGVFVRSMAARGQLGGLSALAYPAIVLMQAVYDLVLVETVGVGQSETEVAGLVDSVMLCIQPASGDSLQFMKAGIMEIPDIAVVTKADIGDAARRAAADLRNALAVLGGQNLSVHICSAQTGEGVDQLFGALLDLLQNRCFLPDQSARRAVQSERWIQTALTVDFGTEGLNALGDLDRVGSCDAPFAKYDRIGSRMRHVLKEFDFFGR